VAGPTAFENRAVVHVLPDPRTRQQALAGVARPEQHGYGVPRIPCARCIDSLWYADAVIARGEDFAGYVHPGACDPSDVAEKERRDMRIVKRASFCWWVAARSDG
jgi:hypothetical protein